MVKVDRKTFKKQYFVKIAKFFGEFSKVMIVNADNVGSKQLQKIRALLRDECEILFGKNTLMRAAITATENEEWMKILPHIVGNIGLIFTNGDLAAVRNTCLENSVKAPARVGAIAPCLVKLDKGPSGLDAQKTSFFQSLNIQTKIVRGNIEIVNDVKILAEGDKVGRSEAALLNLLGISPFNYNLVPTMIYDAGSLYAPKVLDLTEADIIGKFMQGVSTVAAVSLFLGRPNGASVPHMVINGYKNVLAIALATEISFPQAEKAKAFLADPSAFIVAAPAADATADAAAEPEPEEEEEESDDDMDGFSLFD